MFLGSIRKVCWLLLTLCVFVSHQRSTQGGWLPAPLAYCDEFIRQIPPSDVCTLLMLIWRYLYEHPPSASDANIALPLNGRSEGLARFHSKLIERKYVGEVKAVVRKNIVKLARVYHRLFATAS